MTIRAAVLDEPAPPQAVLGVKRSLSGKLWQDRLQGTAVQTALAIAQRHGLPEIVARVVAARGVSVDEAPAFLDPTLKALMPEPYSLTGTEEAAERIARAVTARERVAVFADYDVDGATSAALMLRFLRFFGVEPVLYIPDRITEGYGPNVPAIAGLAESGIDLLVTVDCGTVSHAPLAEAARLGLDVVVIDHHQADETLPRAHAIVNPNRLDDLSGQGHLAAVGVTFLVLVAVNRLLRQRSLAEPPLMAWLELVALGTVCDVVPLTGLNRAYVAKGLVAMRRRQFAGLRALADIARINGPVGCYHLGFLIGPRINAGGRIGRADLGAILLASDDEDEVAAGARQLDILNAERQIMEKAMLAEASAQAEAALMADADLPVLVTAHADWHPGIVGLIASRLKERFGRPAFALALADDGTATGSGRSIAGVDLGRIVRAALGEGLLVKGGGHAMAAGLTVTAEKFPLLPGFLRERLAADVAAACASDGLTLDGAMSAASANLDMVRLIEQAGPFGAGNPSPVFVFPSHRIVSAGVVGEGHVRANIASLDGSRLSGIAFRSADQPLGQALLDRASMPMHVAGSLRIDHWNGTERVQLHICDAAPVR